MNRKYFLTLFIFIFLLAACGGGAEVASDSAPTGNSVGGEFYAEEPLAAPPAFGFSIGRENASSGTTTVVNDQSSSNPVDQTQPPVQDRLIIRTGNIDIVVEDTEESLTDIGRFADQLGGWTVTSELRQQGEDSKSGSITLRIPADDYDEMVGRIKELAIEVTWESSSSQDVTDEYVDLSSRLGNLEATADRVRTFLDEARNVEDALDVNQELSRLEEEIEVIKGRMQYLSQSAAFSTLTVSLTPDELAQPIEVAGWRPEGTAKNAIESLVRALQGIADAGIVIALYILPLALLFGIPGYMLIRVGRNWLRRRNEIIEEPVPQAE